jgi:hypothetical protein
MTRLMRYANAASPAQPLGRYDAVRGSHEHPTLFSPRNSIQQRSDICALLLCQIESATHFHDMDLAQTTDHVYTPLSQATEVRIAIIEPSMHQDAPLRFSFHQACLEDLEGRYEAVSYVWGKPILSFPVHHMTDGSQILVTQNLDQALRRLRHRLDPRWLWADAMCIDQANNQEKAIQIPLMVDIFRGANGVLAWLHQGDESIERGMRILERISRLSKAQEERSGYKEDLASGPTDVWNFLSLPYFRRLWIIQEVVFNLDITFICGISELSWLRLSTALLSNQHEVSARNLSDTGCSTNAIREMATLWRQNCIPGDSSPLQCRKHIIELVLEFETYGCSDPRDRIFALCSISCFREADMVIDYTLDVRTTYRNFAFVCMTSGHAKTILASALARMSDKTAVTWPSWVPDWRLRPTLHNNLWMLGSTVKSVGNMHEGILEIVFEYLCKRKWLGATCDDHLQPLPISTARTTLENSSLFTFLSTIIRLYMKIDTKLSRNPRSLRYILRYLWRHSSQINWYRLEDCVNHLWQSPTESRYTERLCEEELAQAIAHVTKGCCFFEAAFKDDYNLCYGPSDAMEGDIIVLTSWDIIPSGAGNMYHALLLRPVKELRKQLSRFSHGADSTRGPYKLAGHVRVLSLSAGLEKTYISQRWKFYLC